MDCDLDRDAAYQFRANSDRKSQEYSALEIDIAWVISLLRVIRALILVGGVAALIAYLRRRSDLTFLPCAPVRPQTSGKKSGYNFPADSAAVAMDN